MNCFSQINCGLYYQVGETSLFTFSLGFQKAQSFINSELQRICISTKNRRNKRERLIRILLAECASVMVDWVGLLAY